MCKKEEMCQNKGNTKYLENKENRENIKKLENEENNEKRQYKSKVLSQERLKNLESSFSPKDRVKKCGWWSWVEPISL